MDDTSRVYFEYIPYVACLAYHRPCTLAGDGTDAPLSAEPKPSRPRRAISAIGLLVSACCEDRAEEQEARALLMARMGIGLDPDDPSRQPSLAPVRRRAARRARLHALDKWDRVCCISDARVGRRMPRGLVYGVHVACGGALHVSGRSYFKDSKHSCMVGFTACMYCHAVRCMCCAVCCRRYVAPCVMHAARCMSTGTLYAAACCVL
jgi:hypothetical protein